MSSQSDSSGGGENNNNEDNGDCNNKSQTNNAAGDRGRSGTDTADKANTVTVGKLVYKGKTKRYAIVPPSLIMKTSSIDDLLKFWGLTPDFVVEMNSSTRGKGRIITKNNAPHMLKEVFYPNKKGDGKMKTEDLKKAKNPPENANRKKKVQSAEGSEGGMDNNEGQNDANEKKDDKPPLDDLDPEEWKLINDFLESEKSARNSSGDKSFDDEESVRTDPYGNIDHEDKFPSKLKWANKYTQRKIAQALSGVVSTADMLEGVILCHGPPSANERLLEAAIDNTRSDPAIIVVDDLADKTYEQPKKWKELEDNAEDLKKVIDGEKQEKEYQLVLDDGNGKAVQTSLLRNSTVSWPNRSYDDAFLWDDNMGETKNEGKFPWTRASHFIFSRGHGEFHADSLGRNGHICVNGDSTDSGYRKQTGYIIRKSVMTISPCLLFSNTGAETQAYARLINNIAVKDECKRRNVKKPKPHVIVQKQAKSICTWICCCYYNYCKAEDDQVPNPFSQAEMDNDCVESHYEDLRMELRRDALELRGDANLGSDEQGAELSIADVLQIVDLYTNNPRVFRSVVVPCDPFNESSDSIARKLMLSFERSRLERREIGAGDADKHAIEAAWRLHHQLNASKTIKDRWRSVLYFFYIFAGLATTITACAGFLIWNKEKGPIDLTREDLMGFNFTNETERNEAISMYERARDHAFDVMDFNGTKEEWLRWLILGLSIVVSLSAGLLNLFSADQHLLKIQNAQAQILSELFLFRMRIGKYSLDAGDKGEGENGDKTTSRGKPTKSEAKSEESDQKRSDNTSTKMMIARKKFAQAMKDISTDLTSIDLYSDRIAQGDITNEKREELERYVVKKLRLDATYSSDGEMALSGVLTSWDYYRLRVLPSLGMVEKQEDSLRNKTRWLQVLSMLSSSIAVVLSAAGQINTVPVVFIIPAVVATATTFTQLLKVYDFERRFNIASGAAREFGSLNSYWLSLSDLSKTQRSTVSHLVTTCEKLALQFETTSAIQVDKAELGIEENESIKDLVQKHGFSVDIA